MKTLAAIARNMWAVLQGLGAATPLPELGGSDTAGSN
jgi:hypothetical protein